MAYLKNYELAFFDYGDRWKGAVASVEPKNGSEVWGCVWKIPSNFSEDLDRQVEETVLSYFPVYSLVSGTGLSSTQWQVMHYLSL